MIDQRALQIAGLYFRDSSVKISDIPKELANTIANIFYKQAKIYIESSEAKVRPPKAILAQPGEHYIDKIDNYMKYCFRIKKEFRLAWDCIKLLKNTKETEPSQYDMVSEFMVDVLKYKIANAQYKPLIVRKMERKFKKVDEIEGLINLMKI